MAKTRNKMKVAVNYLKHSEISVFEKGRGGGLSAEILTKINAKIVFNIHKVVISICVGTGRCSICWEENAVLPIFCAILEVVHSVQYKRHERFSQ